MALAGAFDEPDFDRRPMDGACLVRAVLGLVISEANLFPGAWVAGPEPGAAQGFNAEIERTAHSALARDDGPPPRDGAFPRLMGATRFPARS